MIFQGYFKVSMTTRMKPAVNIHYCGRTQIFFETKSFFFICAGIGINFSVVDLWWSFFSIKALERLCKALLRLYQGVCVCIS